MWFIVVAAAGGAGVPDLVAWPRTAARPFDLMEGESEIVAGFNIEYGGLAFGMFYVGEFLHAFTVGVLFSTLFLGGWQGPGAETYPAARPGLLLRQGPRRLVHHGLDPRLVPAGAHRSAAVAQLEVPDAAGAADRFADGRGRQAGGRAGVEPHAWRCWRANVGTARGDDGRAGRVWPLGPLPRRAAARPQLPADAILRRRLDDRLADRLPGDRLRHAAGRRDGRRLAQADRTPPCG